MGDVMRSIAFTIIRRRRSEILVNIYRDVVEVNIPQYLLSLRRIIVLVSFSAVNIKKVQNNGLKQDKIARKVLDWLSSRASKMLYSPGSAVNMALNSFSINTQVIIQNRALSLARYLGLSADNHLDGQNGCQ